MLLRHHGPDNGESARPGANQGSWPAQETQSLCDRVSKQIKRTIVEPTGVGKDNSHSDAFNQSRNGPIARGMCVVDQERSGQSVSAGSVSDGSRSSAGRSTELDGCEAHRKNFTGESNDNDDD